MAPSRRSTLSPTRPSQSMTWPTPRSPRKWLDLLEEAATAACKFAKTKRGAKTACKNGAAKTPRATRKNTKHAQLIATLRRTKGANIDEVVEDLEWQSCTMHDAIAGALKKKLGLTIVSEIEHSRTRLPNRGLKLLRSRKREIGTHGHFVVTT